MHNCLDPYFPVEFKVNKPLYLQERYNFNNEPIILTISRVNKDEERKGYEKVIQVLHGIILNDSDTDFRYLLCGKYEPDEFERLNKIITGFNLEGKVILTGFIKEEELIDHYRLADIYIMPSKKEGFGMVYIEAAACGLQVIAGVADGSSEAILNGKIGHLVNPDSLEDIYRILYSLLKKPLIKQKSISDITYHEFSFENYKEKLIKIINET